jgi:DNA-binding MarR family transcriptional regulator
MTRDAFLVKCCRVRFRSVMEKTGEVSGVAPREHVYPVVNLLQVAALLRDELDAGLSAGAGVSIAEHDALMQLLQHGPRVPLGELAELVLFTQSGITRLVDRLEQKGLTRRENSTEDRRITFAALTDKGRAKVDQTMPLVRGIIGTRFSAFVSDQDASELRRMLLTLLRGNGWWDERQYSHGEWSDFH